MGKEERRNRKEIILIILLMIIFCGQFLIGRTHMMRRQARIYAMDLAEETAEHLDRIFYSTQATLSDLVYLLERSAPDEKRMEDNLSYIREHTSFDSIEFIGRDGAYFGETNQDDSVRSRGYYTEGLMGKRGIRAEWDDQSEEPSIVFYQPVFQNGKVLGVLAGFYDTDTLKSFFSSFSGMADSEVIVLDKEGNFIGQSGDKKYDNAFAVIARETAHGDSMRRALKNGLSSEEPDSYIYKENGSMVVAGIKKMELADWYVVRRLIPDKTKVEAVQVGIPGMILLVECTLLFLALLVVQEKRKKEAASGENRLRLSVFDGMLSLYSSLIYVDLEHNCGKILHGTGDRETAEKDFAGYLEKYAEEYIAEGDREAILSILDRDYLEQIGQNGEPYAEFMCQMADKRSWRGVAVIPAVRGEKGISALILASRDVSKYKENEKRLRQTLWEAYEAEKNASDVKSNFLSCMSHEIKTPINGILGMAAIAEANLHDTEKVKGCLNKITLSMKRLTNLMNEVLDMSKIESGRLCLEEKDICLPELFHSFVTEVEPAIREREHHLIVLLNEIRNKEVSGDAERIRQVFMNLVTNSVNYTPKGGTIRLELKELPSELPDMGCYEFICSDNGIGMTKEFVGHIFEPFSREEDARVSKVSGIGLGMAIVQNIVHMMNGMISVKSAPGEGSQITVEFCLKLREDGNAVRDGLAAEEQNNQNKDQYKDQYKDKEDNGYKEDSDKEIGADQGAEENGRVKEEEIREMESSLFAGSRIMVVDDNPLNMEIASEIIRSMGAEVVQAADGNEAVKMYEAAPEGTYDLIFMDLQMPVMDGYQAAEKIRESGRPDSETIPIVAMTANAFAEDIRRTVMAGMNNHLTKPIDIAKLVEIMKMYLHGKN